MDPTGTGRVIYYNMWREVEIKEVHDCFKALSKDAFAEVKVGDVLWQSSEPYAYSAGKVYGYDKIEVVEVRPTNNGIQVYYGGPFARGMFILGRGAFYKLTDEEGLAALVKEHGHKITHLHDPAHDAEIASVRNAFEGEWDARGLPR